MRSRRSRKQATEAVFARTKFSKAIYEQAAHRLVDTGGGVFSHTVGMAYDEATYAGPLRPGRVFTIDPQLRVPEEFRDRRGAADVQTRTHWRSRAARVD